MQNTIALIVPYFGKLPYNFQLWLESCRYNPTIDWLIYTDDETEYDYPENVKVKYCSFGDIKDKIQQLFDFTISLERPYKLCDYKVAYGEIFSDDIEDYSHWGYCDVDLLFGNIRHFITDEILEEYEKIGFQGHLTIYKNTAECKRRYRTCIDGIKNYVEIFSTDESCLFDELVSDKLYGELGIPVYKIVYFAHLLKYCADFRLGYFSKEESYKNKHQIFLWKKGILYRLFLVGNQIKQEEFMYIHFFCRKMRLKIHSYKDGDCVVIYPNQIELCMEENISLKYIKRKAHMSKIVFYIQYVWKNRSKFSFKKIVHACKEIIRQMRK